MSSSWNCEVELRKLADELRVQAGELEIAAKTLKTLRESESMKSKIDEAKNWAKDWMKRDI